MHLVALKGCWLLSILIVISLINSTFICVFKFINLPIIHPKKRKKGNCRFFFPFLFQSKVSRKSSISSLNLKKKEEMSAGYTQNKN